ncbi:hypothetical protein [Kangiella spongicola]|nr:hypothetical protein [Kangiella spongicola]
MAHRKDKPVGKRILSSVASLMFIGSLIFIVIAGFNLYVTTILATGILGLVVPSAMSSEGFLEIIAGFFEALLDGGMEIIGGIFEFFGSLFG